MQNLKNLITIGCPTSTGGKVITGSSDIIVKGLPVALIGDTATCLCGSKSCSGSGPIVKTSPRAATLNGIELAKAGDLVDTGCGSCVLLPGTHNISIGSKTTSQVKMKGKVVMGDGVKINM